MNRPGDYGTALFIIASAVLGAVAIMLVPGLFEELRAARLITIAVLMAGAVVLGVVARRNRQQLAD